MGKASWPVVFEAFPSAGFGEWVVADLDRASEGEVHAARFTGIAAEARAREYAELMTILARASCVSEASVRLVPLITRHLGIHPDPDGHAGPAK